MCFACQGMEDGGEAGLPPSKGTGLEAGAGAQLDISQTIGGPAPLGSAPGRGMVAAGWTSAGTSRLAAAFEGNSAASPTGRTLQPGSRTLPHLSAADMEQHEGCLAIRQHILWKGCGALHRKFVPALALFTSHTVRQSAVRW